MDGGAVAVGDRGHIHGDVTGGGSGFGERGLEPVGVGQVDVAGGAYGRGLLPVAGRDSETRLHVAVCGVVAGSVAGGGVFGHGYSSLVIVTIVPRSVVLISTWSMRACMKAIPWPRVSGCSRGGCQLPVSVTVASTRPCSARTVTVICTGSCPSPRPAVPC